METVYWEWARSGYRSDGESYTGVFCPECRKPYNWFDDALARQTKFFRHCSLTGFVTILDCSTAKVLQSFDTSKIRKPYDLDAEDSINLSDASISAISGQAAKWLQELEQSIQESPDYYTFTFQMYKRKPDLFVILFGQDEYDELTSELLMEKHVQDKVINIE
jgi:hypothetical protein